MWADRLLDSRNFRRKPVLDQSGADRFGTVSVSLQLKNEGKMLSLC